MIRLRLFSSSDPSRQLDQRMVGADPITVGRDAGADWVIADPDRALSRRHCTVRTAGSGIGVRDTSANGTFVADTAERIEAGGETIVPPGGSIRLGTFMLQVEALAAEPVDAPAPVVPPKATPSLFAPPAGMAVSDPLSAPARPDPFASQLAPDPLLSEHRPADRFVLGDGDAWDRRPAARAGDWDVPRDRVEPENLIGTPREWSEPPRQERDAGFGFDAPFDRPVLAPVVPDPASVAIPEDWAEPAAPEPKAKRKKAPVEAPINELAPPLVTPPPVAHEPVAVDPVAPAPPSQSPPPPVASLPAGAKPVAATAADSELFDAFCAGARLSPASFAAGERVAAMTRLGEVYRGMVLGLADLMSERTALKNEYRMTRTMVRAEQNNPFKWVPPQRLAIEVLRGGDGFAGGAEAVSEAFRDIKIHILCMLAGMRAAIEATMGAVAPAPVEAAVEGRSFLIKAQRDAALWIAYVERYERFKIDADDNADGPVNRAFRTAYEKQLGDLLGVSAGYAGGPAGPR